MAGPSDGSGNWDDLTVSNWLSGGVPVTWATNAGGTNAIIGAGVPGIYSVTNINPVTATSVTFSNASMYTISGAQLNINQTAATLPVLISLPNTTNTINQFVQMNQGNDISNAPNSTLTLAGGLTENGGNPRFEGINQSNSILNLTGGIVTDSANASTFQPSGITLNITNAIFNAPARLDLGRNQAQSVAAAAVTVNVFNGGQLNANSLGANNGGNHLQISRGAAAVLNVYPGALVSSRVWSGIATPNTGLPTGGLIRIVPDSNSQGTFNIFGGTVMAGNGANTYGTAGSYSVALTPVTFFDTPANFTANASTRAILNLAGGSLTAYDIAFTTPAGVGTNPTNGISITGGTLYLGAPNISYPVSGTGTNFFFNISGGTISAIQNWSPACSAPITLGNVNGNITFQAADINGSPFNLAFSGPLKGVGGFIKTGGGTLTLSGANNYSGATIVNNGTLIVSTLNSPVGGDLALEGASLGAGLPVNSVVIANSGQSWTIGNLTYDTGTPTADFNYGGFGPSASVPAIQINGNLGFIVTPLVTVEGSAIPVGIFPLIKYTGTLSGTPPTTVALSGGAYSGYITNFTATKTIALVVSSSPIVTPDTWAVGNGVWDTSTPNWNKGGLSAAFQNGDPVTFDDSASGPFPITVEVASGVNPGGTIVNTTNGYTIAGPGSIASGSLTKSGSGSLTLSGTNTYSGGTIIELGGGTLSINYGGDGANNSAIGTGPLTLKTGSKLDNTSGQAVTLLTPITEFWNDDWTFVGTANLNLGVAPVTLGNGQVVLTVVSNLLEVDGQIGDGGLGYGIQKQGAGALTLANFNTFSGGMDVEAGTLNINSDGALGSGPLKLAGGTIDNTSGATVTLNNGPVSISLGSFTFLGTADLDLGSATLTGSATVAVSNNTLFVEGAYSGASTTFTKNGPGVVTIGGSANSGSVTFNINQGTLNLNRQAGFIAVNNQGATINSGGSLVILNPTGTQLNQPALTLNGGLLEWNGDNETVGSLVFNSGIFRDSNPTAASLSVVVGGLLTLGGVADFEITNGATLTINGIVADAGTNVDVLLKTGVGTLILATNTTYTGNTTVSNGVLSLTYSNLATNSTVTIATNATLNLNFANSDTNTVGVLVLNGTNAAVGLHNASTDPAYLTGPGNLLVIPPVTINPNPGTIQISISGNILSLAWPTNAGWLLQAQTNSLQLGLSTNWVTLPGSGAITNLSVTIDPANGSTFYRIAHP